MGKEKMKEDKKTIDISKLRYYVIAFCLFATFVILLNFIFLPSETQPQDTIIIEIKQPVEVNTDEIMIKCNNEELDCLNQCNDIHCKADCVPIYNLCMEEIR